MKEHNSELEFEHKKGLQRAGDLPGSMYDAVNNFLEGRWLKPNFQRSFVWESKKRIAFGRHIVECYEGNKTLIGTIILYQLTGGEDYRLYVLDGIQRINTCVEFLDDHSTWNVSKDNALLILKDTFYPIKLIHCENHEEAARKYQLINIGTYLTPFEYWKISLLSMDKWPFIEESFVRTLNIEITELLWSQFKCNSRARKAKHTAIRAIYGLYWYYLELKKDKTRMGVPSGATKNSPAQYYDDSVSPIEEYIKSKLSEMSVAEIKKTLVDFKSNIKRIIYYLKEIWDKADKGEAWNILPTTRLIRYLLMAILYLERHNVLVEIQTEFINKVYENTMGSGILRLKSGRTTNLGGKSTLMLETVTGAIGMPYLMLKEIRTNAGLDGGLNLSHWPNPIGKGTATIIESEKLNKSRGRQPVLAE